MLFYCIISYCMLQYIILHVAESLLGQSPAMTEEQQENARKRMEANFRETTQQQIERELFTSLLKVIRDPLPTSSLLRIRTHEAVREYGTGIKKLQLPIDFRRNIAGVH